MSDRAFPESHQGVVHAMETSPVHSALPFITLKTWEQMAKEDRRHGRLQLTLEAGTIIHQSQPLRVLLATAELGKRPSSPSSLMD